MDAVTFFGNKRGRKIHQEQQDPRTLFMRTETDTVWNIVQLFEAKSVARRNYFWAIFRTDNFLAWCICAWLWFFAGVSYLHVFKGRSLVENAWNGHQTIVWEDFRLFSTNDGYLWRRVYFLCKSSIMSILYRGTANLLVKSAVYAVISCIKGKIWNAEVRFRLAGVSLCRCGYSEGSVLGCQIFFYAKGQFGQKYFLSCHFDVCSLF